MEGAQIYENGPEVTTGRRRGEGIALPIEREEISSAADPTKKPHSQ